MDNNFGISTKDIHDAITSCGDIYRGPAALLINPKYLEKLERLGNLQISKSEAMLDRINGLKVIQSNFVPTYKFLTKEEYEFFTEPIGKRFREELLNFKIPEINTNDFIEKFKHRTGGSGR